LKEALEEAVLAAGALKSGGLAVESSAAKELREAILAAGGSSSLREASPVSRAHVWRALRAVRMAGSSSRCVAGSSSRAPVKKQRLTVRKEPARGELFEPRLPRGSVGRAFLEQLSEAAPTVKCEPSSPGLVPGLRRYTCKQEASSSSMARILLFASSNDVVYFFTNLCIALTTVNRSFSR
jgi:hypothetical protein